MKALLGRRVSLWEVVGFDRPSSQLVRRLPSWAAISSRARLRSPGIAARCRRTLRGDCLLREPETREIGARIALDAQGSSVYRVILTQAGWLIATGIVIGSACSVAAETLILGRCLAYVCGMCRRWPRSRPYLVFGVPGQLHSRAPRCVGRPGRRSACRIVKAFTATDTGSVLVIGGASAFASQLLPGRRLLQPQFRQRTAHVHFLAAAR